MIKAGYYSPKYKKWIYKQYKSYYFYNKAKKALRKKGISLLDKAW